MLEKPTFLGFDLRLMLKELRQSAEAQKETKYFSYTYYTRLKCIYTLQNRNHFNF